MKPFGVVTEPSAWRLQPSRSPTTIERLQHFLGEFAALAQHRLDDVERRLGEARQIAVALEVEHVGQQEQRVARRALCRRAWRILRRGVRYVGLHMNYLGGKRKGATELFLAKVLGACLSARRKDHKFCLIFRIVERE